MKHAMKPRGGELILKGAVWAIPSKSQTPTEPCEKKGGGKKGFEIMAEGLA